MNTKMVTKIAYRNMKYYKSRNILTGIAMILTTLLLFIVPTLGKGIIDMQFAMINGLHAKYHARYSRIDEDTAKKISAHHDVEKYGLSYNAGIMMTDGTGVAMSYLDDEAVLLSNIRIKEGSFPKKDNEIVVSKGILKEIGQSGEIGDKIKVPYQIYRNGGLDKKEEKEFVITGFVYGGEEDEEASYTAYVSKEFLENEVGSGPLAYTFLFRVNTKSGTNTDEIEEMISNIAIQFDISEKRISINNDYLMASYVDPEMLTIIIAIMIIIVFAGIITIYSIYYVGISERVKEFGRLKAIGATKRQVKQSVLREGMCVAMAAVPLGLILGTIISGIIYKAFKMYYLSKSDIEKQGLSLENILDEANFSLYHLWIYLLAAAVALFTVYLSLKMPMRIAGKVSEIEAMRFQSGTDNNNVSGKADKKVKKQQRKSYIDLTIKRLSQIYLMGNKKKSIITICSMAITGIFFMAVATVISCADPYKSADNDIVGQYEISPVVEFNNKEKPEHEWSNIVKNNPLTDEMKKEIESVKGIKKVDIFELIYIDTDYVEGFTDTIAGIPEEYKDELINGIIDGKVSYEELKSGDKVIVTHSYLHWYPEIKVGDKLKYTISDGEDTYEKEVEIAAIGDYAFGLYNYDAFLMASEGIDKICSNNPNYNTRNYYHIYAEEDYNSETQKALEEIMESASGDVQLRTWKQLYDDWKSAMLITGTAAYLFVGILGAICIMNMINTMINSVHVRKKEIGMMQAIGMSDKQLIKMLRNEGMFYTIGTLLLSITIGSILGYFVFLWAKRDGMFSIREYYYPGKAVLIIVVVLILVQFALTLMIGKSIRKQSLIDRIRFSE